MNDNSSDSSLNKLINLSKSDDRIKIVNNDKNRGLLYSRAMGILNSSGEYLMNVDPDDELEGKDNLEYLYNLTKKNHPEIITFAALFKKYNQIFIINVVYILRRKNSQKYSILFLVKIIL